MPAQDEPKGGSPMPKIRSDVWYGLPDRERLGMPDPEPFTIHACAAGVRRARGHLRPLSSAARSGRVRIRIPVNER